MTDERERMDNRITLDELVSMFGENLPVEAAKLIWNPNGKSVDQVRAALREMVAAPPPPASGEVSKRLKARAEIWQQYANDSMSSTNRAEYSGMSQDVREAADLIDSLTTELSASKEREERMRKALEALWSLWNDKRWTGYKHDYLRGHLSYGGMLAEKEAPIIAALTPASQEKAKS